MLDAATLLALVRGLHLAASFSLLGAIGFILWVAPAAGADGRDVVPSVIRLCRLSGFAAVLTAAAWFVLQSAAIAGASTLKDVTAALSVVAEHTRYGNTVVVRVGLLLLAIGLVSRSRFRSYAALLLTAIALGLQGLIGHAGAMGGRLGAGIIASESLHLLAAGLWLGALVPLWVSLRRLRAHAGSAVCERFSPIGLACVMVITGTGLAQGIELIGGVPALIGTQYGRIALMKVGLFGVALALASINRLWLTDRLSQSASGARARLQWSVAGEALLGLVIICAAALLASSVPAEHELPVWPLSWRFSLVSLAEEPAFKTEVIVSGALIGLAFALLALACLWRRYRIIALAVLAATFAMRGSSLELLMVEAYPTSFQTSPTDFAAASIVRGQQSFVANCVGCHGAQGDGNGVLAGGLRIKPADLTMPHLWEHTDGELFWWLTHGIDDPEGGLAMPGFAALSASDRWALIDYIRAHNAALAMQQDANVELPIPAPAMPIACSGSNAASIADLRGRVVHVVTTGRSAQQSPIPPQSGVRVVLLALQPIDTMAGAPADLGCAAATPAAWPAYAILADVPPEKLSGTEFLIDTAGWLRAIHVAGSPGGWQSRDDLIAAVQGIDANPIQQVSGGEHEHHH